MLRGKQVTEEFLISELSVRANVTLRTIRYYTSEGLMPDPIKRGSRYYYTQEHVDRLEQIDRLKRRYLPLQEIKRILNNSSPEDMHKLIEMQNVYSGKKDAAKSQDVKENSNAQEHIRELLYRQPEWDPDKGSIPSRGHRKIQGASLHHKLELEPDSKSWKHISLAPGVELHVLETLDQETKTLLEELIQYGRRLLGSQKKEGR
jgi:DNA-binding transcriptional MerR regulator